MCFLQFPELTLVENIDVSTCFNIFDTFYWEALIQIRILLVPWVPIVPRPFLLEFCAQSSTHLGGPGQDVASQYLVSFHWAGTLEKWWKQLQDLAGKSPFLTDDPPLNTFASEGFPVDFPCLMTGGYCLWQRTEGILSGILRGIWRAIGGMKEWDALCFIAMENEVMMFHSYLKLPYGTTLWSRRFDGIYLQHMWWISSFWSFQWGRWGYGIWDIRWSGVGCLNKAVSSLRQNPVDGPNQSQQAPGLVYPVVPFGN